MKNKDGDFKCIIVMLSIVIVLIFVLFRNDIKDGFKKQSVGNTNSMVNLGEIELISTRTTCTIGTIQYVAVYDNKTKIVYLKSSGCNTLSILYDIDGKPMTLDKL